MTVQFLRVDRKMLGLRGIFNGETFYISPDETAEQVLQRSIDHLEKIVKKYNLEEKFKARGLTLYQGITLASIIQRESIGCGVWCGNLRGSA